MSVCAWQQQATTNQEGIRISHTHSAHTCGRRSRHLSASSTPHLFIHTTHYFIRIFGSTHRYWVRDTNALAIYLTWPVTLGPKYKANIECEFNAPPVISISFCYSLNRNAAMRCGGNLLPPRNIISQTLLYSMQWNIIIIILGDGKATSSSFIASCSSERNGWHHLPKGAAAFGNELSLFCRYSSYLRYAILFLFFLVLLFSLLFICSYSSNEAFGITSLQYCCIMFEVFWRNGAPLSTDYVCGVCCVVFIMSVPSGTHKSNAFGRTSPQHTRTHNVCCDHSIIICFCFLGKISDQKYYDKWRADVPRGENWAPHVRLALHVINL